MINEGWLLRIEKLHFNKNFKNGSNIITFILFIFLASISSKVLNIEDMNITPSIYRPRSGMRWFVNHFFPQIGAEWDLHIKIGIDFQHYRLNFSPLLPKKNKCSLSKTISNKYFIKHMSNIIYNLILKQRLYPFYSFFEKLKWFSLYGLVCHKLEKFGIVLFTLRRVTIIVNYY